MHNYLELALKKEKKPASFEKLVTRIEKIKSDELGREVHLTPEEKQELLELLEEEVSKYEVFKTPSDNYIALYKTSFRKGRFYGCRDGGGRVYVNTTYVNRDGELIINEDKYEITKDNAAGAIDGDFVLIDIGSNGSAVCVKEILDRNLDYIPGEVYCIGGHYYVKPADKRKQNITISLTGEAIEGTRVAVSLDQQTAPDFYIGSIVRVFNHKDDPNEDILWEAFKMGVDDEFSNESLEQLEHMPDSIRDIDRIGREDHTDEITFTIDDISTKDMDDSVGLYINEKGNYVLRVDITDISSLIPYNSPLDRDGFRKGNSYYPGGIVIPNYPRKISNGIGSLNPGVDRLTISDILEITPTGEVVGYRFVPTVIRSRLKMSYQKVNDILKNGLIDSEYQEYTETLHLMRKLAVILHKNRTNRGAAEFNRPELKGIYSANGHITGISVRHQDVAENLIEEFMLIANEYRAKYFAKNGIPCVYRVHDKPNVDRLMNYLTMLKAIGLPFYEYDAEELASNPHAFQKLIDHASSQGRISSMLSTELIKTLSRAKYSYINTGHNGLAMNYYSQGTSPVRRYGDKTNQDIAWDCIFRPDPTGKKRRIWGQRLPEITERITHTERVADDLEKEVLYMQCAEYMKQFEGQEFEATVISISDDCLNVVLDNLIEGTVRARDMKGDYIHCEESYSLVSLDGEDNYFIGDRLLLRLKKADKESKRIDFVVIEKINETHVENAEEINMAVKIKTKNERAKRTRRKK